MERKIREEEEAKRNMPDEDGFVTVMRRGKKGNSDGNVTVHALRVEEASKLKPREVGQVDFYRFQAREAKRKQIAELREVINLDSSGLRRIKSGLQC